MNNNKVMMTAKQLSELAEVSVAGGTEIAWMGVARQWIIQADAHIDKVTEERDELQAQLSAALLDNLSKEVKQGF